MKKTILILSLLFIVACSTPGGLFGKKYKDCKWFGTEGTPQMYELEDIEYMCKSVDVDLKEMMGEDQDTFNYRSVTQCVRTIQHNGMPGLMCTEWN